MNYALMTFDVGLFLGMLLLLEVGRRIAAKRGGAPSLQGEIWSQAVAACRADAPPSATLLLLPALNQMIDITAVRTVAALTARADPPRCVRQVLVEVRESMR